jgi:hypothetical protein
VTLLPQPPGPALKRSSGNLCRRRPFESERNPVNDLQPPVMGSGFYVLSAKVAFAGRALTILSRTHPEKRDATRVPSVNFSYELKTVVPPHCQRVLVTAAGSSSSGSPRVHRAWLFGEAKREVGRTSTEMAYLARAPPRAPRKQLLGTAASHQSVDAPRRRDNP